MALLTPQMKDMIASHQCFVGTCSQDLVPNVAPKRSTRVIDDSTIVFTEGTARQTLNNLRENPRVAIAVVNREKLDGYRFLGRAEVLETGTLYEEACNLAEKAGLNKPRAVVRVAVEEIYSLKPGPMAGTRIE